MKKWAPNEKNIHENKEEATTSIENTQTPQISIHNQKIDKSPAIYQMKSKQRTNESLVEAWTEVRKKR